MYDETNREKQIYYVHKNQDKVTDARLVVYVASGNQSNGNEVVAKHLPVVLPSFFNMND